MLPAEARHEGRAGKLAAPFRRLHEVLDLGREHREGVALDEVVERVVGHEGVEVVAADAEGRLREVVRAVGEELAVAGEFSCADGRRGQLDHGADLVGNGLGPELLPHLFLDLDEAAVVLALDVLAEDDELELGRVHDDGDHDLGPDVHLLLLELVDGLEDGPHLHLVDLREGDGDAAATVAEHRVELLVGVDPGLDFRLRELLGRLARAEVLHEVVHLRVVVREEFMEGRVEEADGHFLAGHDLEDAVEVVALHGLELLERLHALFLRVREDHLADDVDALLVEEHVLGADEADALGAEKEGQGGVSRVVRVRAHVEVAHLGLGHGDEVEEARILGVRLDEVGLAEPDLGLAVVGHVDGDVVALVEGDIAYRGLLAADLHLGLDHGDLAVLAGDDRSVGGETSLAGEDARGDLDGLHVLGESGGHHEDEALVLALLLGRPEGFDEGLGAEVGPAYGRAGSARYAARDSGQLLHAREIHHRVEDLVEPSRGNRLHDELVRDDLAGVEVEEELQVRLGGLGHDLALLDEPELLVLDREADLADLDVLVLELPRDLLELLEVGGVDRVDVLAGGADLVEALLVILALELALARDDVAGVEGAGGRALAVVAVDHGLDEDGGVAGILLVELDEARYALDGEVELAHGLREEALREEGRELVHECGCGLGSLVGGEGLHHLPLDLAELLEVLRPLLELGKADLDGQHAAHEEEDLVGREVVADPRGEAGYRVLRKAEVVEGRIVGDGQVGRNDDLEKEGILLASHLLADELLDLPELGLGELERLVLVEGRGDVGVKDEARQDGQGEVGEFHRLTAALPELFHVANLLRSLVLAEEVYVVLHDFSLLPSDSGSKERQDGIDGAPEEGLEHGARALREVALQLGDVLDVLAGHGELDGRAVLDLAPLEEGVEVRYALSVVVHEDLEVGVLEIVARDDPFPRLDVAVVEELVRDDHRVHGGHPRTGLHRPLGLHRRLEFRLGGRRRGGRLCCAGLCGGIHLGCGCLGRGRDLGLLRLGRRLRGLWSLVGAVTLEDGRLDLRLPPREEVDDRGRGVLEDIRFAFLAEASGPDDEELGTRQPVDFRDAGGILRVDGDGSEVGMVVDGDEVHAIPALRLLRNGREVLGHLEKIGRNRLVAVLGPEDHGDDWKEVFLRQAPVFHEPLDDVGEVFLRRNILNRSDYRLDVPDGRVEILTVCQAFEMTCEAPHVRRFLLLLKARPSGPRWSDGL